MSVAEAQQLIALSLDKVAAARGKRTGPNLRKNVLLSTLLHKARFVIISGNDEHDQDTQENKDNSDLYQDDNKVTSLESQEDFSLSSEPRSSEVPELEEFDDSELSLETDDKENVNTSNQDVEQLQNCRKCIKRRNSETNTDETGPTTVQTEIVCKRRKTQLTESDKKNNSDSSISCLVMQFNSGLSGLLVNNSQDNQNSSTRCSGEISTSASCIPKSVVAMTV